MAKRPCLGLPGQPCGRPTSSTRCPACEQQHQRVRNARRTHYQQGWEQRSKQARQAWIAEHGLTCPGVGRPPHPTTHLELDHTTGRVLCHQCNVNAGPAGADAAIPH